MTLTLNQLSACFEGVIPSIISTVSASGVPNISYLTRVMQVDATHVALSNQFFGKTERNLRAFPRAVIVIVDGRTGRQYRLDTLFVRSETSGPLFERVSVELHASGAQHPTGVVMQLRAVSIFLVTSIEEVRSQHQPLREAAADAGKVNMAAAATLLAHMSDATDLGEIVDVLLDGVLRELDCDAACLFLRDPERPVLTTIGSRGYGRSGVGSEIPLGTGPAGAAAASRLPVKISDMSRAHRFGAAVRASTMDESRTRTIIPPGLEGVMSQFAIPIFVARQLTGVILVESRRRLAFGQDAEHFLDIVSRHAGALMVIREMAGQEVPVAAHIDSGEPIARGLKVVHHTYDDSVFIEDVYVIKGVAGRLLALILELYAGDGRLDFSNRELRLNATMRLPDFKDNLETRLLLLRRRLEEKDIGIKLVRTGRGQLRLELKGHPELVHV